MSTIIREYTPKDREQVRKISLATAVLGRPSSLFFEGDEVLADALTMYFTDYEPESSFVAEADGQVVGYIISAKDSRHMEHVFSSKIFWPLLKKALKQRVFWSAKNWKLFGRAIGVALRGGFFIPNFNAEYPATIHINILDEYRSLGVGEQLMRRCLQYLGNVDVPGVRLATMSDRAGHFFQQNGFRLFYFSTRPYFYDVFNKDVPLKIYCRKIE